MDTALISLITIVFGILVFLLVLIFTPDLGLKGDMKRRVKKYFKSDRVEDLHDQVLKERNRIGLHGRGKQLFVSKELTNMITASGLKLTPQEFLIAWMLVTFVPMLLLGILTKNIISALGIGIVGFVILPLLLRRATAKRRDAFTQQLSEVMVVIGNCLKGGFSFQQAMESVATEMLPPISTEFEHALREMRLGVSMEEALTHMSNRIQNPDLEIFVSAVITSAKVGSNLSEILDTISATIKDRIRIKQEVRVLTAQGRISGIIIGLLPVFLLVVLMIMNPVYFGTFFHSSLGRIMLGASIILEFIGFTIIKKITNISY